MAAAPPPTAAAATTPPADGPPGEAPPDGDPGPARDVGADELVDDGEPSVRDAKLSEPEGKAGDATRPAEVPELPLGPKAWTVGWPARPAWDWAAATDVGTD